MFEDDFVKSLVFLHAVGLFTMSPGEHTLLIVDDETELRDLVARDLEKKGFEVLKASGGNEALELVKNFKVNLVLSDLQMPDGSGLELLEGIKKNPHGSPPVVFLTGHMGVSEDQLLKLGAAAVVPKPFKRDFLYKVITKTLKVEN